MSGFDAQRVLIGQIRDYFGEGLTKLLAPFSKECEAAACFGQGFEVRLDGLEPFSAPKPHDEERRVAVADRPHDIL